MAIYKGSTLVSGGGGSDVNAVHYTAETKTAEQKAQARANIATGYELYEHITLAEDTTLIERAANGSTFFNSERVYIAFAFGTGAGNGAVSVGAYNGNSYIFGNQCSNVIKAGVTYAMYEAYAENGIWRTDFVYGASQGGSTTSCGRTVKVPPNMVSAYPYVDKILIASKTAGIPIPAGTEIYIYGVRIGG